MMTRLAVALIVFSATGLPAMADDGRRISSDELDTLLAAASRAVPGAVLTRFEPPSQTVVLGGSFTVDIVADIDTPVVGWGLDLSLVTPGIASLSGPPAIGASWFPASALDGDGFAGLASPLPPTNGSVSGIGIVLATLSFSADAIGTTDLVASITPGDLSEGFALDPTGFATVTFQPGQVIVVPEPTTTAFLLIAGVLALRRRKR